MKRYRMIAALGAFLGLLLLKLAFPGLAAGLREKLHIVQDAPQAVEAFKELGKRLSLREAPAAERAPVFVKKPGTVKDFADVSFSYYVRLADVSAADAAEEFERYFDKVRVLEGSPLGKTELICSGATLRDLEKLLDGRKDVESVIRMG